MDTGGGGNNSGEDPPLLPGNTTLSQLLHRTTVSFASLLPTILLLSSLLFFFHSFVENGTVFVTSFIDRDPSLRSLLSRLDIAGKNLDASSHSSPLAGASRPLSAERHRRRRGGPFLQLTRLGTIDDDFFSGDDDDGRSIFGNNRKTLVNGSFLALSDFSSSLGFSDVVVDNGVKYPEVIRNGVSFKLDGRVDEDIEIDGEMNLTVDGSTEGSENAKEDRAVDFRFFIAGLELGHRDAAALLFLISLISAAYGWMIFGFVITYSWVLGILFITVANDLLGRYVSFAGSIWSGSKLGIKRLSGFILMRWAVRDALTQILGLWFFGEIEDQYSFLKLFLRLKLMPFSTASPWIGGYEKEVSGFLVAWFLMDTLVSFVFTVDSWVTMASARRNGREIVVEGCNLLATMFLPAVFLKFLEVILCGFLVKWGLAQIFGRSCALMFQLLVEVYFLVAWLIFYFVVRNRDASLNGRTFGRRELERLIEGLR